MKLTSLNRGIAIALALTLVLSAGCTGVGGNSGDSGNEATSTTGSGYTLTGTVVDDRTDEPISGARVLVNGKQTETDDDGRFVLEGIPGGNYTLVAEKSGYRTSEMEIGISGERSVELHLKNDDFYSPSNATLLQTHWENNVSCEDCHGAPEGEIDDPVSAERCTECHEINSLRNETAAVEPNPHDDPHGYFKNCGSCHLIHEPSKNGCAECHSSGIIPDVP